VGTNPADVGKDLNKVPVGKKRGKRVAGECVAWGVRNAKRETKEESRTLTRRDNRPFRDIKKTTAKGRKDRFQSEGESMNFS